MKNYNTISFENITIDKGFWLDKQKLIADVSLPNIYKRFDSTSRFDVIYPWWKKPFVKAHIFYDSDTAKWIEAAAYVLAKYRTEYPELEKLCDDLIARFARLQKKNGYVNSAFQRSFRRKYAHRTDHELYCTGHLAEAALAYKNATGKDSLLKIVDKNLEYIKKRFIDKKNTSYFTPGHEEIELALYRLYEATKDAKYREIAEYFLNGRGRHPKVDKTYKDRNSYYDQSEKPIRELDCAHGHCVRAMYLYSAMADMARINDDEKLSDTCKRLFEDVKTKMYITGGIGSTSIGEAFTSPYDLPNLTAYAESCASIGLLMFVRRMLKMDNDGEYADIIERIMYNNLLSGISLDGKSFFYENPLEIRQSEFTKNICEKIPPRLPIIQRQEVFQTSCCPPNIVRFIAAIGDNIYTEDDECVFLHQYIASTLKGDLGEIKIITEYPNKGTIKIVAENFVKDHFALRIPSWCADYELTLNDVKVNEKADKGYVTLSVGNKFVIELTLEMEPKYMYCNPLSYDNRNRVALMVGPRVYCVESVDNGSLSAIAVDVNEKVDVLDDGRQGFVTTAHREYSDSTYSDMPPKAEKIRLQFIPYSNFANRGKSDMMVWLPVHIV